MQTTSEPADHQPLSSYQAVVQIFHVLMTHGGRVHAGAVPGYVFVQGVHGAPVAVRVS